MSRRNGNRAGVVRRRSVSFVAAAAAIALAARAGVAANTEYDVVNGQTDLTLAGTYTTGGTPGTGAGGTPAASPPGVTSDVTFDSGVTYSPAAFTINSDITFGSLNDLSGTAITISNTGASASNLTLGGAGNLGDGVPGSASGDLLFVASGGSLTISPGTGPLGITLGQSGNFDVAGTATIGSVISDGGNAFGITKTGTGTLIVTGVNTYTGPTTVNAGTLQIGNASNAQVSNGGSPTAAGTINLKDGTTLDFAEVNGATNNNPINVSGTVTLQDGIGSGTLNLGNGNGSTATLLTGSGTINLAGSGTISMNASMSGFTGTINWPSAASVTIRMNGNTNNNFGGTGILFDLGTRTGNTLQNRNGNLTIDLGGLQSESGGGVLRGQQTAGSGGATFVSTYSIGALNTNTTFTGVVTDGPVAGATTAIVKVGTGILTLTGKNTYTAGTTINGGTLEVDNTSAGLANGAVTIGASGTLAGKGTIANAGTNAVTVNGTIAPGTPSTGTTTADLTTGPEAWSSGGTYDWKLNLATPGTPGTLNTDKTGTNWDQLMMASLLSASSSFNIQVIGFTPSGQTATFNPGQSYQWVAANMPAGSSPSVLGTSFVLPAPAGFSAYGSALGVFTASLQGTPGGDTTDDLVVTYTPAPEPTSLALLGLATGGLLFRRGRRGR